MFKYDAPVNPSTTPQAVVDEWNRQIVEKFNSQIADQPAAAPFLQPNPESVAGAGDPVGAHWPADPAEPRTCINAEWAEKLSDWGARGRSNFHNEYCEYGAIYKIDSSGKIRLKRIVATTELPEFWLSMATADPAFLKTSAEEVLGFAVSYDDLYGRSNPVEMSPQERRLAFAFQTSGNCKEPALVDAHVPAIPVGPLNINNVLFMRHPINGLDDLIYIVAFGAQPYAVASQASIRPATLHEIFRHSGALQLACRNADPAAAAAAYSFAVTQDPGPSTVRGSAMAFANPLGMFIQSFNPDPFTLDGEALPAAWIKKLRGVEAQWQRIEIGPSDDDPRFLDEAMVEDIAGSPVPLVSGYQIAKRIEVGPYLVVGETQDFSVDLIEVLANDVNLNCSEAKVCEGIADLKAIYQQEQNVRKNRK